MPVERLLAGTSGASLVVGLARIGNWGECD